MQQIRIPIYDEHIRKKAEDLLLKAQVNYEVDDGEPLYKKARVKTFNQMVENCPKGYFVKTLKFTGIYGEPVKMYMYVEEKHRSLDK